MIDTRDIAQHVVRRLIDILASPPKQYVELDMETAEQVSAYAKDHTQPLPAGLSRSLRQISRLLPVPSHPTGQTIRLYRPAEDDFVDAAEAIPDAIDKAFLEPAIRALANDLTFRTTYTLPVPHGVDSAASITQERLHVRVIRQHVEDGYWLRLDVMGTDDLSGKAES